MIFNLLAGSNRPGPEPGKRGYFPESGSEGFPDTRGRSEYKEPWILLTRKKGK